MYDKFNPNYYVNLEDDSAMIQAAVDAAAETGDAVTIPRHNARTGEDMWHICRAIQLHTGSVVYLDNCHLRQVDLIDCNIFRNSNNGTPLGFTREGRQYNITIEGIGNCVLDGGKTTGVTEENFRDAGLLGAQEESVFYFMNVENVKINNFHIQNYRYWSAVFYYSSHVEFRNIDFYGPWQWRNQDGIDLRNGCSHFLIENLTGALGDDVVALSDLMNYREEKMMECGYDDSIHNIIVQNVRCATTHSFVRILNHGGRKIYNVLIQNCMIDCESDPTDDRICPGAIPTPISNGYNWIHPERDRPQDYSIRINTFDFYHRDPNGHAQLGDTSNITIRNLTCRGLAGVCLACTAQDVLIENVRMFGRGLSAVYFAQGPMRNIRVRDVYYSENCKTYDEWDDRLMECEKEGNNDKDIANFPERQLCAVYFKDSDVENATFRNIHAGKNLNCVFGGYGHARATCEGLTKANPDIPDNAGIGDIQIEVK